jgi:hypothetical protein
VGKKGGSKKGGSPLNAIRKRGGGMMTALSLLAIPHRHSIPLQRRTCCRHHHRHLRDNRCGVPHHHSSLKNRRGAEKKSELQYIKSNVLRYALPSSMIGTSSSSQQQLHSHPPPLSSVFSRHVRIGRRFPALLSPHTQQLPLLAAVHPGNLLFSSLASSTVRTTATTTSIRRLELLNSSIISKSQQLNWTQQQRRDLSTTTTTTTTTTGDELCPEELEANIIRLSKSMAWGLMSRGYWTNFHPHYHHHHHHHHHNSNDENSDSDGGGVSVVDDNNNNNEDSIVIKQQQHLLLPPKVISNMRQQAMALRHVDKRYVQSVSESINIHTGQVEQFVKPGVYACEPDGSDYYTAPDILHYIATVLRTLPPILNDTILSPSPSAVTSSATTSAVTNTLHLRNDAFNAKLAVTCAGGYKYPRHVDNVSPPPRSSNNNNNNDDDGGNWDVRKLTVILYLNPVWKMGDGGELRLYFPTPITMNDHSNNNNIDDDELSSSSSSSSTTNNYIDLSPVGGRVVLFWSDEISHEVLANAPHVVADNTLSSSSSSSSSSMEDDASLFDRYALTIWIPSDNDSLRRSFIITPTTTTTTTTTTVTT